MLTSAPPGWNFCTTTAEVVFFAAVRSSVVGVEIHYVTTIDTTTTYYGLIILLLRTSIQLIIIIIITFPARSRWWCSSSTWWARRCSMVLPPPCMLSWRVTYERWFERRRVWYWTWRDLTRRDAAFFDRTRGDVTHGHARSCIPTCVTYVITDGIGTPNPNLKLWLSWSFSYTLVNLRSF